MASLILETTREEQSAHDKRVEQLQSLIESRPPTEKLNLALGPQERWLRYIWARYGIGYSTYRALEVIFRQLMNHPKLNTGFQFHLDNYSESLAGKKSPQERMASIDSYLAKSDMTDYYGLHSLMLDKQNLIQKVQLSLSKQFSDIEVLLSITGEKSSNDPHQLELLSIAKELEALKRKASKAALDRIKIQKRELNGFVKVNEKTGELTVNLTRFEFFRHYCILYYHLLKPYFELRQQVDTYGRLDGIDADEFEAPNDEVSATTPFGFIAAKMNFEFGSSLGTKISSDRISERIHAMKTLQHYEQAPFELGLVDKDFYRMLAVRSNPDFEFPFGVNKTRPRNRKAA